MIRQALILAVLAALLGVATHFLHPRAPAWYLTEEPLRDDEVTLERVQSEWKGDVLWIDARPTDQFEAGHVPEAKPLNEQSFDDQLFELLETLQTNTLPVIIYCGGESCHASRTVRQKLLERVPLENVFVLRGGWKTWLDAGGQVAAGS